MLAFSSDCLSVEGERITSKNLARAVTEFGALPDVTLGFSPLPGANRVFSGSEIQRIASQYGIQTGFHDTVCFAWPMRPLDRSAVRQAVQDVLGSSGFEIDGYSLFPVPPGPIVFPINGLNRQPQGSSFWRGYVEYSPGKRFNIWAKVSLDGGTAIGGRADVLGGSHVTVLVRSGAAEVKLEAQAMTSGLKGQTVTIRNPRSGRSFTALVTGKDNVVVEAGTEVGGREK
jgi:hypothetical protein